MAFLLLSIMQMIYFLHIVRVIPIVDLEHALGSTFTIKDLSEARFFLWLEICDTSHGILVNQRKYVLNILIDVGMMGCNKPRFLCPLV